MFLGSTALEVAIGMIFVYLLMSLLCSAVAEYIEAKLNNRSKDLEKGIRLLLDPPPPQKGDAKPAGSWWGRWFGPPASGGQTTPPGPDGTNVKTLTEMLYEHPLVTSLYRGEKLPSYIPSRTFALALWDMAVPAEKRADDAGGQPSLATIRQAVNDNTFIGPDMKKALLMLIDDAKGDFEKARKNIEDWYDGTMDRVSGWYKRRVQVVLLIIGFLVAAFVNADSVNIARALMQDDALRQSVVASAEKAAAAPASSPTPPPADQIRNIRAQINALGLPVGWVTSGGATDPNDPRRFPGDAGGWLLKALGLLITALAVSQGAPFWFDLLNKFIVIRSTVKPKEKSQPEGTKDKKKEDGRQ